MEAGERVLKDWGETGEDGERIGRPCEGLVRLGRDLGGQGETGEVRERVWDGR